MAKLSVLIPCFNERPTIAEIVRRILAADVCGLDLEVVLVDDGSTDGSADVIAHVEATEPNIRVVTHAHNRGKGAALRSAQSVCRGEIVIVQDADLEYDPQNYPELLQPLLADRADAVFGSRFAGGRARRVLLYSHELGNRWLTAFSNLTTDFNLTDMSTGAKAFRGDLFRSIPICSDGFSVEPEITAKLARLDCRLYEVPIDYHGRSHLAGKKIRWSDGLLMGLAIVRYWATDSLQGLDEGLETLQSMRYAKRYNSWVMARISSLIGDRVLEAGAGIGNLTSHLLNRELVVAADNNSSYIRRLEAAFAHNPNVQTRILDIENPSELRSLEELELDTVICVNVVEHLRNDSGVLRGFHDVLVPGGRAIVLVPNGRWLYGSIDESIGHYRRYTRPGFRSKMEAAGFAVEEVLGINRLASPFWFLNGRVLRRRSVSNMQVKLFDVVVPALKHIDRFLPFPPLSIIAVGRKL